MAQVNNQKSNLEAYFLQVSDPLDLEVPYDIEWAEVAIDNLMDKSYLHLKIKGETPVSCQLPMEGPAELPKIVRALQQHELIKAYVRHKKEVMVLEAKVASLEGKLKKEQKVNDLGTDKLIKMMEMTILEANMNAKQKANAIKQDAQKVLYDKYLGGGELPF